MPSKLNRQLNAALLDLAAAKPLGRAPTTAPDGSPAAPQPRTFDAWLRSYTFPPEPPPAQPTPSTEAPAKPGPPSSVRALTAPTPAARGDEERFLREFVRTGYDSIEAARRAGFPNPILDGPALARRGGVAKAVKALQAAALSVHDLTRERVALQIARLAFFDPARAQDEHGAQIPLRDLDDDTRAAVKTLDQHGRYTFYDRQKALAQAADILGMNDRTVNVKHSGSVKINLDALSDQELNEVLSIAEAAQTASPAPTDQTDDVEEATFEPAD